MNEKIVTHEDLPRLQYIVNRFTPEASDVRDLLDRLIAAAEADQPPLPEGWVAIEPHEVRAGDIVSVYYEGRDDYEGHRYTGRVGVDEDGGVFSIHDAERDFLAVYLTLLSKAPDGVRDFRRLTPLRPTVTEADVEKAAQSLYVLQRGEWVSGKGIRSGGTPWGTSAESAEHGRFLTLARAAFEAAGIEVQS